MKTNQAKFLIASLALLATVPAFAATTAFFAPATISAIAGQKFDLVVSVNPQGTANFAEKIEVVFPPEILEVASFAPAATWIGLTQPGYDSLDATRGILIKTSGYPSGFTTATAFGTISFQTKKVGTGVIKLGSASRAFDANGEIPLTSAGEVTISVRAPIPAAAPTTPKAQTVTAPAGTPASVEAGKPAPTTEKAATPDTEEENDEAEIGELGAAAAEAEGGGISWKMIVGILALLALVGYGVWTTFKKEKI